MRWVEWFPSKNNAIFTVLKAAWANFGSVKMTELEEGVMAFDFDSDSDRDRILDMPPWAIHGHCLNLKLWLPNRSISEVEFGKIQMWVHVHGLSAEMMNSENARQIALKVGTFLAVDSEKEMKVRGYIRIKSELDVTTPVCPGFWWANDRGEENWAKIKYERLSDFCYGCGRLGHTAQGCNLEIVSSEENGRLPMYGSWTACPRQRKLSSWVKLGGGHMSTNPIRDPARKTWQEMMKEGTVDENKDVRVDGSGGYVSNPGEPRRPGNGSLPVLAF